MHTRSPTTTHMHSCTHPPACAPHTLTAFTKGWDMTLVMLATVPFLAGMGFAISIFMGRNTTKINAAYAGEHWVGAVGAGCGCRVR